MPKYSFVCDTCVLGFERSLKMGEHPHYPCPSCKADATRVWEDTGLAFGFTDSSNNAPANSGVHKEDYPTADHLIGKDAEKRWGVLHEREKVKAAAREQGGSHALIRTTADEFIDYEPMSNVGRDARRKLARATIDAVRAQKATK